MDVEFRSCWFAREFTQFCPEYLLGINIEILITENNNTSLGDWGQIKSLGMRILRMAKSLINSSALSDFNN